MEDKSLYDEVRSQEKQNTAEATNTATSIAKDYEEKLKAGLNKKYEQRIPTFVAMRQAYDRIMNTDDIKMMDADPKDIHNALQYELFNGAAEVQDQSQQAVNFQKEKADALSRQQKNIYDAITIADKLDKMFKQGAPREEVVNIFNKLDPQTQRHVAQIKEINKSLNINNQPEQISYDDLAKKIQNRSPITKSAQEILTETFNLPQQ